MEYKTQTSKQKLFSRVAATILALSFCSAAISAPNNKVNALYYRYIDENGVKSTSSSIPAKYAQNGYEIITRSGKIITVAPAPDPEEVKRKEAILAKQREETAAFELLARRYSSIDEIYSARDRRLTHLNASISILENNITNIKKHIDELTTKAANSERAGREVPLRVLTAIKETKAELVTTETKLDIRTKERDEIHKKFEGDVKLFEKGHAYRNAQKAAQAAD